MNSFLKSFAASLLAIFVAIPMAFFVSIIFIAAIGASFSSDTETVIKKNTILKLTLATPIMDNPETDVFSSFDFSTMEVTKKASLLSTVSAIEAAKNDDNIVGIYIEPSMFAQTGFATIEEIRNALLDFKSSGKFIVTYADNLSQGAYYLSSVSDEIYMNSVGDFGLKGLATTMTFYKGLLDKLGVEPQIIRHGKYKSFIEPFTAKEMSKENRLQTESLLNSVWDNILSNISDSRKLDKKELSKLISSLELVSPEGALKYKLIDGVKHHDEVMDKLSELSNVDSADDLEFLDINSYTSAVVTNKSENKIAVIYAEGDIMYGNVQNGVISNKDIISKFKKAKKDDNVKAIVFRINSGGGSALASELMWREIELVRQEKPVIVSFGNAAASGGYYIAAASDAILCSPTTITGSIGVFSLFFNLEDAMRDKLGITTQTIQTNDGASILSPYRAMTEAEENVLVKQTENFYDTFVNRVAKGRNLSYEEVDEIAQGRVWSGSQAVKNGLVDGLGGIKQAIALAADKAGIVDDFEYFTVKANKSQFDLVLDALSEAKAKFTSDDILLREMSKIKKAISVEPLQAKMPFEIEFNAVRNQSNL